MVARALRWYSLGDCPSLMVPSHRRVSSGALREGSQSRHTVPPHPTTHCGLSWDLEWGSANLCSSESDPPHRILCAPPPSSRLLVS